MSYFFYSEIFHFINLWNNPGFLVEMFFLLAVGIIFRYVVSTKKVFYSILAGMVVLWVISEGIYATILSADIMGLLELAMYCFTGSWGLLNIFVGSLICHLICIFTHKRTLI